MNLKSVSVLEYIGCDQLFVRYAVILNAGNISGQDQSMAVTGTYESFPEKVWQWDKVQRKLSVQMHKDKHHSLSNFYLPFLVDCVFPTFFF